MAFLVLKLDQLPSIAQEVEQISQEYIQLSEDVRKGNKQAYQDLTMLQARIRARIEEFDRFYDRNYADYRIGYFEKMKLRLRKLISPHIDVNRLIYEQTQNYNQMPAISPQKQVVTQNSHIQNTQNMQNTQIAQQSTPKQKNNQQSNKKKSPQKKSPQKKVVVKKIQPEQPKPKKQDMVFTIKMSKEEYLQYVQAKQKRN